jgi:putative DNA primase/helicase
VSAAGTTAKAGPDDLTPEEEAQAEAAAAQEGEPDADAGPSWTETRMAEEVVKQYGRDIRFCGPWHKWLFWDGIRWRMDHSGHVARIVKKQIRKLHIWAIEKGYGEAAKVFAKAEKRSVREAVQALAAVEAEVQIAPEDFDCDLWLLNVRNGTINLKTGRLRAHRREDYCTKLAPVDYDADAKAPNWDRFLLEIFDCKTGLVEFVQRAAGYSLTAAVTDHCFFLLHGTGRNGKTTLVEVLLALLGDYADAGLDDLLLESHGDRHPTELADLFGRRLVACTETGEGRRLNETRIKKLTGADRIKARRMREDPWSFSPTHKLWLATNHRPAIRGTDIAIWSRVLLLPFTLSFLGREDKKLPEKLRRELPGILAWAVRGCLDWQRNGLQPPPEVKAATDAYRHAEDRLAAFVADCCVTGPGKQVTFAELYGAFNAWAKARNEFVPTATAFGLRLTERGFEPGTFGRAKSAIRRGIGLLEGVRVGTGESPGFPHSARTQETNRETYPHRPAEGREPGSDNGENGDAPCGR